uniref:Uncharacterized protein n=1 Tax=Phlebotomus papatasi TaxID=29031 RepID=A0A1B0D525_PHLPP
MDGNGPSGIALSFMLAGHWPYWNSQDVESHPDELLRARLNYADNGKSLVEQDLATLADGLEGRSTNPVSLLLDSLTHPCADLGMELPSMVHYKYHPEKKIDHIVVGKGRAGGSWHKMDPNLRTLSLSAWMSLPGLGFNEWESKNPPKPSAEGNERENGQCSCGKPSEKHCQKIDVENNNLREDASFCHQCTKRRKSSTSPRKASIRQNHSKEVETRALISRVAEYYESYVKEMDLERFFMNDATVTSITPFRCLPGRETCGRAKDARSPAVRLLNTWITCIPDCRQIVIASAALKPAPTIRTGFRVRLSDGRITSKAASKWGSSCLSQGIKRRSPRIPRRLARSDEPLASTTLRHRMVKALFLRNPVTIQDKMLPENVYPEYHEVHRMMKSPHEAHSCYTPLPEHTIADVVSVPSSSGEDRRRVTVRHIKTVLSTVAV